MIKIIRKLEISYKIDKDGNESVVTWSYKIKFIDSVRFMVRWLSNLVDNLVEGIHKIKCKDCNLIKHKCLPLPCNKNYSSKIDEKLKKQFKKTLTFFNNDINKFILLLRKSVLSLWKHGWLGKF